MTVHRGEHLPEGIDYLHAFLVDVRPVLRIGGTPQAEHHVDELLLAASRLAFGRDEGLKDEFAARCHSGIEHRVFQKNYTGYVTVTVSKWFELSLTYFPCLEEDALESLRR